MDISSIGIKSKWWATYPVYKFLTLIIKKKQPYLINICIIKIKIWVENWKEVWIVWYQDFKKKKDFKHMAAIGMIVNK